MANHNTQKQPRQNNSLSWWWDKTASPLKPFKSWKEISFEYSLLDRTGLGLLIRILFICAAHDFHHTILGNKRKWTPLERILTAPVFAALALPLELWNALDLLVACVATPLLWAGERMVNAVLDVFEPLPDEQPGNPGPDTFDEQPTRMAHTTVFSSRSASATPEVPSSAQNRTQAGTPSP